MAAQARGVVWRGSNGRLYAKGIDWEGVADVTDAPQGSLGYNAVHDGFYEQIADPNPQTNASLGAMATNTNKNNAPDAAAVKEAQDAAMRTKLRGELKGKGGDLESVYNSLFGDLDNLVRSRDSELETQYGGQLDKAADTYATALPQIETSYAAIGAADSTDTSDAKTGAKKGFDETTKTIKTNKETDKAKLGQYANEQKAKFTTDKESAARNIGRADETTDVDALRSMRNDVEGNIDTAKTTRATLGTDEGARGTVSQLTADNGRFDAAVTALDSIIKSSMSGSVKDAAVQAVTDSAGLNDEEKKKIQQTYGNVYAEQAAL